MHLTVPGLVLRVTTYNDTDALLTVLTQKYGKLTLKARGLRRKNSPLAATCQLLAYCEFTLFEYRGMYTINEAHIIELFQGLRSDIQKLSLGTYFLQVAEAISQEDISNPQLLSLVLNCLYALSNSDISEMMVKAAFELRSICLAGYTPDLSACGNCGSVYADRFDISEGRLECELCRDPASGGIRMPVSAGVLDAMRYICSCDIKRIFSFQVGEQTLTGLAQIAEGYLITQLECSFSTLDFYKALLLQVQELK